MNRQQYRTELGNRIHQARREAKLTQAELARFVPMRQAGLSEVETGTRDINTEILCRIARETNKSITFFLPPWNPIHD